MGETWRAPALILLYGCFFLVALWELSWPRRELSTSVGPRWLGNLAVYFINGAIFAWLFSVPADAAARIETSLGIGLFRWPQSVPVANFAIGFVILDFTRYWLHRMFHAISLLWLLHSVHHADSDVDVSTSFRHHPAEFIIGSAFFWIIFVITGFPSEIVAAYFLCTSLMSCLQHGNIRLPPSWDLLLQKVIVTTDMHRLHHSALTDEANSNFGFLFSFWDRLFATHRQIPSMAHEAVEFGLREFRNPSFTQMLLLPLKLRQSITD